MTPRMVPLMVDGSGKKEKEKRVCRGNGRRQNRERGECVFVGVGNGGEYQGKTDSVCVCVTHVWRKTAHNLMLRTSPCKKTRGTRGKTGGKMKNKNDRQTDV